MPTHPLANLNTQAQTWCQQHDIAALWLPTGDAHLNEYLAPQHQWREALSGFTGSQGNLLITPTQSLLWADSRYHEQAETQLQGTGITLMRQGNTDVPLLHEWLAQQAKTLPAEGVLTVAVVAEFITAQQATTLQQAVGKACPSRPTPLVWHWLSPAQLAEAATEWATQAHTTLPASLVSTSSATVPVWQHPTLYAGQTRPQKLAQLRTWLADNALEALPLSKLDDIAWLTNLRGGDIPYNPVFWAFAWVTPTAALLWCHASALSDELTTALEADGWTLCPYDGFWADVDHLAQDACVVGWHAASHSQALYVALQQAKATLRPAEAWVSDTKALKHPAEIAGMHTANLLASRALCRFLAWCDAQALAGTPLTEAALAQHLAHLYANEPLTEEPAFIGLSFSTIMGAGTHSSIIHYGNYDEATPLTQGDWLLVDSGAQYASGTTDTTRTLTWGGQATPDQRHAYTAVLRAHIACAMQRFPQGTTGQALDAITRAPLWQAGLNYGHGTGHGVGACLNVHEGPNGLHAKATTVLKAGHVCSIEPGFYRPQWGGIRLENLAVVVEDHDATTHTQANPWLCWQPLTWVPFNAPLIDPTALTTAELAWLNAYHAQVLAKLVPYVSTCATTLAWLNKACKKLG
jgi:Xaa-Pro aminopeptidase